VGAPDDTALNHWLFVPAAVELYADVDVAKITPHWVGAVDVPVPPEPTARALDRVVTPLRVIVLVPDVVPIMIVLVPVPDPPVPMLIALIAPATAPVPMLIVEAPVTDVPRLNAVFAEKLAVAPLNVAVELAMVIVPAVDPMTKVVAAPNKANEAGLAVANTVAREADPVIDVAFARSNVLDFTLVVPVETPMFMLLLPAPVPPVAMFTVFELAALLPDAMFVVEAAVVAIKVNDVDSPNIVIAAEVPVMDVALVKVKVALPIVAVPVDAPKLKVVADVALKVVALFAVNVELNTDTVPLTAVVPMLEVAELTVNVPVETPTLTLDAPAPAPPVAKFNVLAFVPLLPVAMLVVEVAVVAIKVNVVDSPNIVMAAEVPVMDVALVKVKVVLPIVAVPVDAPRLNDVADVALKVVALLAVKLELRIATTPLTAVVPMLEVAEFTVNVPVATPTLTLDAPAPVPPVAMFTALTLAPLFPVAMFVVEAAVVPIKVNVVDSPNIVIAAEVPVMDVALVNVIVAFLIEAVPDVAPIVKVAAEPKIVAVVAAPKTAREAGLAEEKTVARPVEPLIVVALGKSIVAFLIVPVPEVAPKVKVAAAPKAFTVAALTLNNVNDVAFVATVGLSMVNVLVPAVVPMVIVVV
jgi:hypothetical protein